MFRDPQMGDYATQSTLTDGTVYPQAFPQAAMAEGRSETIAINAIASPDS
ncbi:MAG: hypothetical protein AAF329_06655 [Cyanobacteria bacterium P01_A01_bin.17]